MYMGVADHQVDDEPFFSDPGAALSSANMPDGRVTVHLKDFYAAARYNCAKPEQAEWLARLLTCYQSTFSIGDEDLS